MSALRKPRTFCGRDGCVLGTFRTRRGAERFRRRIDRIIEAASGHRDDLDLVVPKWLGLVGEREYLPRWARQTAVLRGGRYLYVVAALAGDEVERVTPRPPAPGPEAIL